MAAVRAPCFFFQRGFCRNGSDCRFAHVVVEGAAAEVCGICFDDVKTRYGLLTGCEHAFCLECIRQWRCRAGGEHEPGIEARNSNKRTCPICRERSDFVVPSLVLVKGEAKAGVVRAYKSNLSKIPCRYFTGSPDSEEPGECPFGNSCFYLHMRPDGSVVDKDSAAAAIWPRPPHSALLPGHGRGRRPPRSQRGNRLRATDDLFTGLISSLMLEASDDDLGTNEASEILIEISDRTRLFNEFFAALVQIGD